MKRGYCEGGPLHGQLKSVLHGAAFVDALTHARYGWCEGRWVYMGDQRMTASDPPSRASPYPGRGDN